MWQANDYLSDTEEKQYIIHQVCPGKTKSDRKQISTCSLSTSHRWIYWTSWKNIQCHLCKKTLLVLKDLVCHTELEMFKTYGLYIKMMVCINLRYLLQFANIQKKFRPFSSICLTQIYPQRTYMTALRDMSNRKVIDHRMSRKMILILNKNANSNNRNLYI